MDARLEDVLVERPRSGATVVTFSGEHDLATAPEVEELLASLIEQDEDVMVDFSNAAFVDSSMIHTLLKVNQAAREQGRGLRLRLGIAPVVRRAFELCGLLGELDVVSEEEVLSGAGAKAP